MNASTTTVVALLAAVMGADAYVAPKMLNLNHGPTNEAYRFRYSTPDEPYLTRLRNEHELDKCVSGCKDDLARVRAVCHWVNGRWDHNGSNEPKKRDPLSILEEAKTGRRFRCVEYAAVTQGCLGALGITARTVALKTADVETRKSGAGHVVVEAWLNDAKRWVLLDPQEDAVFTRDGVPINAVELQMALAEQAAGISLGQNHADASTYTRWMTQYLFYFDIKLDNRVGVADRQPGKLMLVPRGAKKPTVFQRKHPTKDCTYTHAIRAFYAPPE
ncbi:MAG: transglutaminase domain-containing protein [bacterium]|nr:transglutaminase domain-containing protein [bacterium]